MMIDCQHQTHFSLNHQMIQVGTALESYDDIIASEAFVTTFSCKKKMNFELLTTTTWSQKMNEKIRCSLPW